MLTVMVDKESFGILDHLKWSDLNFSQYISDTLNCSLFFIYITHRIFRMLCKSLIATYTYF